MYGMKSRDVLIIAITVTLLLLSHLVTPAAVACKCGRALSDGSTPTPRQQMEGYDAVFVGKVISVGDEPENGIWRGTKAVLEVERAWKGATQTQVVVHTGPQQCCNCSVSFDEGERWLVYARSDTENQLSTVTCDPTRIGDVSPALIAQLGEGYTPTEKVQLADPRTSPLYFRIVIGVAIVGSLLVLTLRIARRSFRH
ncbi:MAG: hypothetical protein M3441_00265 [Chloroflexota bacterium]|nr:hypothetical protein [Chloroflexota bacterium]